MSRCNQKKTFRQARGFTLLEALVSVAVLAILTTLLFSVFSQTSRVWRESTNTMDAFKSAREAFDLLTTRLSEATLNPYWAYEFQQVSGVAVPQAYRRESDLHFLAQPSGLAGLSGAVFFQAPTGSTKKMKDDKLEFGGLNELLTDTGFFVEHGSDASWKPTSPLMGSIAPKHRYRLVQWTQPAEQSGPFRSDQTWLPPASTDSANTAPIGENIIALVVHPKRSPQEEAVAGVLPGGFTYDSRSGAASSPQPVTANQLPPLVDVVLVAIDEKSASRLAAESGTSPPSKIATALSGRLQSPATLDKDLEDLGDDLTSHGISYRIFRATIPIHSSKWSEG